MSNDVPPLTYLGTQSRETVNMETALAVRAAVEDARGATRSLAEHVRDGAAAGAAKYTRSDPIRAVLVAAGAGALLMIVAARMARSGARAVRRQVGR
jgi:hypothetical protein